MLVSFSFGNFKCFKEENTISFVAGLSDAKNEYSVPTPFSYSVLKTAAVYGANASGKSKLFEAIAASDSFYANAAREELEKIF